MDVGLGGSVGPYNSDGSSRDQIIREHCYTGMPIVLRREPDNPVDANAVAVCIEVRGWFRGKSLKQIGYIKAGTAKSLSKRIDRGDPVPAHIDYLNASPERNVPVVALALEWRK